MEERDHSKPVVSWPVVLVVVAVVGGIWLAQPRLSSSRPDIMPDETQVFARDEFVRARLWQDPLAVVALHRRAFDSPETPLESFTKLESLTGKVQEHLKKTNNVHVLIVLVSGGPYVEERESRIRQRNAVLSALNVAGFTPENSVHIGYVRIGWPEDARIDTICLSTAIPGEGHELILPYEWLEDRSASEKTLVLWFNEEALGGHPLARLAGVVRLFGEPRKSHYSKAKQPDGTGTVHVSILGPRISTTLRTMLLENIKDGFDTEKEDSAGTSIRNRRPLEHVRMFSPWATAADALLARAIDVPRSNLRRQLVQRRLATHGLEFVNVVVPDDELAGALLAELRLRGLDPANESVGIALIAEWDTLYGRSLPLAVVAEVQALQQQAANESVPQSVHTPVIDRHLIYERLHADWRTGPANVYRYSYLRGLDGKLPTDLPERKNPTTQDQLQTARGRTHGEAWERPEGYGRLDYARRLAEEIKSRTKLDSTKIRVIGVLGSDTYDKLLLLQALRPHFKNAIFFTTDLDAVLLHPSERRWARNLIVASGFGLTLRPQLQRDIPPFRDSYQSSVFLATLMAANHPEGSRLDDLTARVFEIGRGRAYDLSLTRPGSSPYPLPHQHRRLPQLQYSDGSLVAASVTFVIALGLFAMMHRGTLKWRQANDFPVALATFGTTLPENAKPVRRLEKIEAWVCVVLTTLLVALLVVDQFRPEGEPFSLTGGISVWPTELIRLLVVLLCLIWMMRARRRLIANKDELCRDFKLPGREKTDGKANKGRKWSASKSLTRLLQYRKRISIAAWEGDKVKAKSNAPSTVAVAEVWKQYNRLGTLAARLARFVPATICYILSAIGLFLLFGFPFRPHRGTVSSVADLVALIFSIVALTGVTFYVADASRLCRTFIRKLSFSKLKWPHTTIRNFKKDLNLPDSLLGQWIALRLIARRTKVIEPLIYYPFLALFLMILSRNSVFDRWDWPVALILVLSMTSIYAGYSVFTLRRASEHCRSKTLERLRDRLIQSLAGRSTRGRAASPSSERIYAGEANADQIRFLIQAVERLRTGAFSPVTQQPVLRAVLMPFGGVGALVLLDYFAR